MVRDWREIFAEKTRTIPLKRTDYELYCWLGDRMILAVSAAKIEAAAEAGRPITHECGCHWREVWEDPERAHYIAAKYIETMARKRNG